MGMDLKPIRPTNAAPRDENGRVQWGRYNWTGWRWLTNQLIEWGVDINEFDGCNDGKKISATTCRKVADAIETHLDELSDYDQAWLKPHIVLWRTCGGYCQW